MIRWILIGETGDSIESEVRLDSVCRASGALQLRIGPIGNHLPSRSDNPSIGLGSKVECLFVPHPPRPSNTMQSLTMNLGYFLAEGDKGPEDWTKGRGLLPWRLQIGLAAWSVKRDADSIAAVTAKTTSRPNNHPLYNPIRVLCVYRN